MDIRIINISNGPHEMNSEAANVIDFNKLSLETTARLRYSDQSDYVGFQIDLMIMQDKVQMFKSGFLVGLTVEGWSEDLQKGLDLNNNRSKLPEICKTVWMVATGIVAVQSACPHFNGFILPDIDFDQFSKDVILIPNHAE